MGSGYFDHITYADHQGLAWVVLFTFADVPPLVRII
jgi:hypothetical protein